ncbi:MAG: FdtA/QdtA family cupin domain-containing protein [Bacteroidales bacterium]|nr:FdtA/QdtA family cupin domain-containing protein [Bacteroidales bacterium]
MEPKVIPLPTATDYRGNLTFVEHPSGMPFEPMRVYWIYDTHQLREREGHAFYTQHELIIALSGSFDVQVVTAQGELTYRLDRPDRGLYVPPLSWRSISAMATNAVILVMSSTLFDEADYIRDFQEYQEIIANGEE